MSSPLTEFRAGALAILPITLAAMPFALILGAEAIRHGMTSAEIVLMSLMVFAGSSQFMAVGLWADPAPWASLAFAVYLINMRHTLMGASLAHKIEHFRPWQRWLAAFVMADEVWALAERRASQQRLTPAYYAGLGMVLYVSWATTTGVGSIIGGLIPKPELYGLDFAFPATFICLVMGFAKSWRALPIIAASAVAALIVHAAVAGMWFIIAGALAGMIAAILTPGEEDAA